MLIWITEEYKEVYREGIENTNTGIIINMALEAYQKPCLLGESFLKKVNSLLISLGLFGTFLGLTSAIGNIGGILAGSEGQLFIESMESDIFNILISSFNGMSVAFITSLFGIGFSILLSISAGLIGAPDAKRLFITQLEEYLDIRLASEIQESKFKLALDYKDQMNILTDTLAETVQQFNTTLRSYTSELSSLKNFNSEFKKNLILSQKDTDMLCNSLGQASKAFDYSGNRITVLADEFKNLVEQVNIQNQRLEGTNRIILELTQKLNESSIDRKLFLKAIDEIPDRLLNYTEAAVARVERGM